MSDLQLALSTLMVCVVMVCLTSIWLEKWPWQK